MVVIYTTMNDDNDDNERDDDDDDDDNDDVASMTESVLVFGQLYSTTKWLTLSLPGVISIHILLSILIHCQADR